LVERWHGAGYPDDSGRMFTGDTLSTWGKEKGKIEQSNFTLYPQQRVGLNICLSRKRSFGGKNSWSRACRKDEPQKRYGERYWLAEEKSWGISSIGDRGLNAPVLWVAGESKLRSRGQLRQEGGMFGFGGKLEKDWGRVQLYCLHSL